MRDTILNQLAELEGKTPEQIDQFVFEAGIDKAESKRRLALKIRREQADPNKVAKYYWSRSLQTQVVVDASGRKTVDCVVGYRLSEEGGQIELVYGLAADANSAGSLNGLFQINAESYPFDFPAFDGRSRVMFVGAAQELVRANVSIIEVPLGNVDYPARRVSQVLQLDGKQLVLQGPTPAYRDASRALVPSGDYFLDQEQQDAYARALQLVAKETPEALRVAQVRAEVACGAALLSKAAADFKAASTANLEKKKVNRKTEEGLIADFNTGVWKDVVSIQQLIVSCQPVLNPNYALNDQSAERLGLTQQWQAVKKARAEAAAVDLVASVDVTKNIVKAALEKLKAEVRQGILDRLSAPQILSLRFPANSNRDVIVNFCFITEETLHNNRISFKKFSITDRFIELCAPELKALQLSQDGRAKVYAAFRAELKNQVSDYLTAKHHEIEERKRLEALPKTVKANVLLEAAKNAYFAKHEKRREKANDLGSYHSAFMRRLVGQLQEQGEAELSLQALALAIAPKPRQNRYCLFGDRGRTVLRENALQNASDESLNADKYGTDAALQAVIQALRK